MKRPVRLLSMIAAAWLAAPAAMAGNEIVKCVDTQGRVTLTDQPCVDGGVAIRMAEDRAAGITRVPAPQRHILPATELPRPAWRPAIPRAAPLARDIATLKAARRALMLMHGQRASLAGLP